MKSRNPSDTSRRYRWTVVAMLWGICFFNYADRQALSAIFPLLKQEFHFTPIELGWIGAAFTWIYALTAPFAGQVGDRNSRKTVILGGLTVWSAITGFTALCSHVWHFILVRGAEGLGETFYFPASMSMISDYHGPATRSRAMSLHQTSVYAGTIGGSALAGWMGMHFGWRSPFLLLGIAGVLLGVVLSAFLREPLRNQAEHDGHAAFDAPPVPLSQFLGELLQTPTALCLMLAFFGANFVALVFLTWMPTFLKEKFSLDLASAGLGATFFLQIASMVGATLGGLLADRWSPWCPGGRILVQALGASLGGPFIFACGFTRDLWMLAGAMTLFGLSKGLYDSNLWAALYDVIPASRRATAVGWMNMIGWLGGGLGALAIGTAVSKGVSMSAAIASTAGIYLLVAALLLWAALQFAPRDSARAKSK